MRKRALPSIIFWKAVFASLSGRTSVMGRMPCRAAKVMVSCTSWAVPEGWPRTSRPLRISWKGLMGIGAGVAPMTTSSPRGPRPSTVSAMAAELPAVASTTFAPPSACRASATGPAVLST